MFRDQLVVHVLLRFAITSTKKKELQLLRLLARPAACIAIIQSRTHKSSIMPVPDQHPFNLVVPTYRIYGIITTLGMFFGEGRLDVYIYIYIHIYIYVYVAMGYD